MQPNFEKVPIWHYPLPEGSPRVCTGYYFRRLERVTVPPIDVPSILDSVTVPEPEDIDGGTEVPLVPEPKGPKPIGGIAMPLPKVLRP